MGRRPDNGVLATEKGGNVDVVTDVGLGLGTLRVTVVVIVLPVLMLVVWGKWGRWPTMKTSESDFRSRLV